MSFFFFHQNWNTKISVRVAREYRNLQLYNPSDIAFVLGTKAIFEGLDFFILSTSIRRQIFAMICENLAL